MGGSVGAMQCRACLFDKSMGAKSPGCPHVCFHTSNACRHNTLPQDVIRDLTYCVCLTSSIPQPLSTCRHDTLAQDVIPDLQRRVADCERAAQVWSRHHTECQRITYGRAQ